MSNIFIVAVLDKLTEWCGYTFKSLQVTKVSSQTL